MRLLRLAGQVDDNADNLLFLLLLLFLFMMMMMMRVIAMLCTD